MTKTANNQESRLKSIGQIAASVSMALYAYSLQKSLIVLGRIGSQPFALDSATFAQEPLLISAVTLLLFGLMSIKVSSKLLATIAFAAGTITQILTIGVFALAHHEFISPTAVFTVYQITRSASVALCTISWVHLFAHLNPLSAALANAICIVASTTITFGLEQNAAGRLAVMMIVMTAIVIACFAKEQ